MTAIAFFMIFHLWIGNVHSSCFKDKPTANTSWLWQPSIGSKYENIDSTDDCLEHCLDDYNCVAINYKVEEKECYLYNFMVEEENCETSCESKMMTRPVPESCNLIKNTVNPYNERQMFEVCLPLLSICKENMKLKNIVKKLIDDKMDQISQNLVQLSDKNKAAEKKMQKEIDLMKLELSLSREQLYVNSTNGHHIRFDSYEGSVYYFHKSQARISWKQAENKCKEMFLRKSELASIPSANVFNYFKSKIEEYKLGYMFVGGKRKTATSSEWIWLDGTSMDAELYNKKYWSNQQPDNYGGYENILMMFGNQGGGLNDYRDTIRNDASTFVCRIFI